MQRLRALPSVDWVSCSKLAAKPEFWNLTEDTKRAPLVDAWRSSTSTPISRLMLPRLPHSTTTSGRRSSPFAEPTTGFPRSSTRRAVNAFVALLNGNNQPNRDPKNTREGVDQMTSTIPMEPWPWPDDLDAMIAAPGFHAVLFEDHRVRVLEGRVSPSTTVPVHTHRWGGILYVLSTSDFVRRDPEGNVLADTRASGSKPVVGTAVWGGPLTPHSFENVGSSEFHTITVEMKDQDLPSTRSERVPNQHTSHNQRPEE